MLLFFLLSSLSVLLFVLILIIADCAGYDPRN